MDDDTKVFDWICSLFPETPSVASDLNSVLHENPGRISRAYRSLLEGYLSSPSTLLKVALEVPEQDHTGLVACSNIPFMSMCAHHFLPFFGTLDVVYEPGPYIVGLGKLPRLVDCQSRRFQLQEILVKSICQNMIEIAKAKGAYVRCVARHTCVCYRGPLAFPTMTQTTYSAGSLSGSERMLEIQSMLQATQI